MKRKICIAGLLLLGFVILVSSATAQVPDTLEQVSDTLIISGPSDNLELEVSPDAAKWHFDPGHIDNQAPSRCWCNNPVDDCRCGWLIQAPPMPGIYPGIPFFVDGKLHIYCGLKGTATCVVGD